MSSATILPFSRFQAIKANGRESYLRHVHLTKFMNSPAQKGTPQLTARDKAHRRGLSLDTTRARACPHNLVAVIPLPQVVQDVDQGVPLIKAPVPRHAQRTGTVPVYGLQRPIAPRPLPLPLVTRALPKDIPMDETDDLESIFLSPMEDSDSSQNSSASSSSGIMTPVCSSSYALANPFSSDFV